MKTIVFATKNKGKIKEAKEIFAEFNFNILSMQDIGFTDEISEDGDTFEANAFIKARTLQKLTGYPILADDSGLSVELLGGEPGVRSARYAGESATDSENVQKLLLALKCQPKPHHAKFICCGVFLHGENSIVRQGEVKGQIIDAPRGISGFGYDPVFVPDGFDQTMAELTPEMKNSLSHRGKAFRQIAQELIKT